MPTSDHSKTIEYAAASPPRTGRRRPVIALITFAISMVVCTAACTASWQTCVTDVLYQCSDPIGLDYLQGPRGWVHGAVVGQPGNYGDTIRAGWSMGRLEALWL